MPWKYKYFQDFRSRNDDLTLTILQLGSTLKNKTLWFITAAPASNKPILKSREISIFLLLTFTDLIWYLPAPLGCFLVTKIW